MLTLSDMFCGAGGSSSGAAVVPGVQVRMAGNHWRLAVETHNTNHPNADHDVADLSQVDPRRWPATDLLWASPSCTNHSLAKGRRRADQTPDLLGQVLPDEAAERSRATMWDVPRFAEHHAYRGIVVENVVDVRDWVMWPAWLHAMDCLGYDLRVVYLNSMFAGRLGDPAPQSRDRLYVVCWQRGDTAPNLDRWTRPAAWCPTCETTVRAVQAWKRPDRAHGRYRAQYVYRCPSVRCRNTIVEPPVRPAATVIDWSLLGERIGDRPRPLAAKTVARIEAGLARYGRAMQVPLRANGVARPVDAAPLMTVAAGGTHHGLLVPAGGTWNDAASPTGEPFRTRTTRDAEALVMPAAMILRNQNSRGGQMCTPVDEPIRTVMASSRQSLVTWMVVDYNGPARRVSDPLPTQTTVEGNGLASVAPEVDDCLFRMLAPHEIRGAMAFDAGYRVLGNRREQVRQLGNAVTPPAARDLIAALAEAITGESLSTTTESEAAC